MWGRRKDDVSTSSNPEVQEAMHERDELIDKVQSAVDKVDDLQGELIRQYALAEREGRIRWS